MLIWFQKWQLPIIKPTQKRNKTKAIYLQFFAVDAKSQDKSHKGKNTNLG